MKSKLHSYLLTFGHIASDINQGALPAMLPFLIVAYDLNLTMASFLFFASTACSAIIQPLFGHLGDKMQKPWFMSLGIILAGAGIAALGFATSYWMMLGCAIISGIGVALFHPEGGRLANAVSGAKKGAGMSNFAVGGNIGFALGPLIIVFAISVWGIQGSIVMLIPTSIMAIILLTQTGKYTKFSNEEFGKAKKAGGVKLKDDWQGYIKVTIVSCTRAIISSSFIVFIPLYWIFVYLQPEATSPILITVFSATGAIATFFGGRISDAIGFKQLILLCVCLQVPIMIFFVLTSEVILGFMLVIMMALCLNLMYAPLVSTGQAYLPNRVGLASGISLGVVVSVGGMATPIIGAVADAQGLMIGMSILVVFAILAMIFGIRLTKAKEPPADPTLKKEETLPKPTKAEQKALSEPEPTEAKEEVEPEPAEAEQEAELEPEPESAKAE